MEQMRLMQRLKQMQADHFSADPSRSYEFVRLRMKGLKQQDLDVVIVINIFSFSRWIGPLWFIGWREYFRKLESA